MLNTIFEQLISRPLPRLVAAAALLVLGQLPTPAARADMPSILDASRLPHLGEEGRADYRRFVLQPTPRVFALSPDGAWGWAAAIEDGAAATEARALENCSRYGGTGCQVYARDLAGGLARPRGDRADPARDADRRRKSWNLTPDRRFIWNGAERRAAPISGRMAAPPAAPTAAAASRSRMPAPSTTPATTSSASTATPPPTRPRPAPPGCGRRWPSSAAAATRRWSPPVSRAAPGTRCSRSPSPGWWTPVIAIAPAAHGPTGSPAHAWALDDLRRVIAGARTPQARVVVANFANDEFDPDPVQRAAIFGALTGRAAGLLLLDRPAGIRGHGGGNDWRFTLRYATCLLDFAEGRVRGC
jgi:hypothetical protein